jgi:hypothetical protein
MIALRTAATPGSRIAVSFSFFLLLAITLSRPFEFLRRYPLSAVRE